MSQLLIGATLIDGTGAPAQRDVAVLINGARIEAVGPRQTMPRASEAEVIDCSGMTLLPGLIDCHDHLASHTYSLAHRWGLDQPQSTRHIRTATVLQNTLSTGYTTVREAAGLDAGFKQAIEEGLIQGPRLLLAIKSSRPSAVSATASAPRATPVAFPRIRLCPMVWRMARQACGQLCVPWSVPGRM
jgi:imidazolonepropionase-like amidohydrolase